MTTINNIADLARILKEQPEWAATLRGLLLTEELLNLPAQFAEFVQETRESNRLANERQTRLEELTRIINERLIHVEEYTRSLNERMNRLEGRFSNYEGIQYEHGVRNKPLFRAQRRFKLEEPYLAMVQDAQSAPALNRVISQAINTAPSPTRNVQSFRMPTSSSLTRITGTRYSKFPLPPTIRTLNGPRAGPTSCG